MVYEKIKEGYNSVLVYGNSEKITVEMLRGGRKIYSGFVINRYPKILERLWPCAYNGLFIFHPTEEIFRSRIAVATKLCFDLAVSFDRNDMDEEEKIVKKREKEERERMSIELFVNSLKK